MPSYLRGKVDTTEILQSRRDFDWSGIHMKYVNQFPLPWLLAGENGINKEKATDAKFNHFEDEIPGDTITKNGAANDSKTSGLVFDSVDHVIAGDIIHNPKTNENMLVSSVDTGANTVDVTARGLGGTSASAIDNDQVFFLIGTSFAEGTGAATAVTSKVSLEYNYCQIFKRSVNLTKTLAASTLYGGAQEKHEIEKQEYRFERDLNYALQFGSRSASETNQRQTGGLRDWISTNVSDCNGETLDQSTFDTFLKDCFSSTVGTSETGKKVIIGSPLMMERINDFANATLRTQNPGGDIRFGVNVVTYINAHGVVDIYQDKLLKGDTYGYWGWCLDLGLLKYKYLRDVTLRRNIQNPETDAIKHELIGELGLKLIAEEGHGIIKNFT